MQLRIRIITGAKKTELIGRCGNTLRMFVPGNSYDGFANDRIIEFLANYFEIKKSCIKIMKGHAGKEKLIEINGKCESELSRILDTIP